MPFTKAQPVGDANTPTKSIETQPSMLTEQQLEGMSAILNYVYSYRTEDGEDPSKLFHRKVNKRIIPDYYDIIKEPMAMSAIKAKLNTNEYKTFEEFVRDWALIFHNAQLYNSPSAGAYIDALLLKDVVAEELQKLANAGVVTKAQIEYPFLGVIPPPDDPPAAEEESQDDDDEEEEDDEEDDTEDEGRKKKKRGRPSLASKRDPKIENKDKEDDPDVRKKRGRPPRVDTPMEARIKAIIKGLRKLKNSQGDLMVLAFERLPDKADEPGYYNQIKSPIALDTIKRKLKRKKYSTVDQFMRDIELMFHNAQTYNEDDSQIYRDAVTLQQEARVLAEAEKRKPDSEFTLEDGRVPLPGGILHNGELWKVGDWVHIQNANDMTKPIVAQIYRTWQDQDGSHWVNACWYYRPEQTVHRFDRHFFDNEVVKTGQYRDHPIDEVVDRCFVMFFTRYNKGRPRGFPKDKEVYVCECRYNEEKHKLNKIKTWASCLPDEVRDKDYEMDLFDAPRRLKKIPSPIAYLFKESEQKETDDLPKPIWGAPNAPPKMGAVHCRPRDPKDSPPPEPTPTPPPRPPPQPARQISSHQTTGASERPIHINPMSANTVRQLHPSGTPQALSTPTTFTPGHVAHAPTYHPSPSPVPPHAQLQHQNSYGGHHVPSYSQIQPQHQASHTNSNATQQQASRNTVGGPPPIAYRAPNPVEVWHLPDSANASIPEDIRSQFQTDAQGRVLFFTAPPAPPSKAKKELKHSTKYLAWRARKELEQEETKKRSSELQASGGAEQHEATKKPRSSNTQKPAQHSAEELVTRAAQSISEMLLSGLMSQLSAEHGEERAQQAFKTHLEHLHQLRAAKAEEEETRDQLVQEQEIKTQLVSQMGGLTRMLDYRPPNEHLEWPSRN